MDHTPLEITITPGDTGEFVVSVASGSAIYFEDYVKDKSQAIKKAQQCCEAYIGVLVPVLS